MSSTSTSAVCLLPATLFLFKFVEIAIMETILVQANNNEQVKLLQAFLKQHKLKSRVLSEEDKEDIVLGRLMEETDYKEVIDTDAFLQKLRS
jgi:hypothetical protein